MPHRRLLAFFKDTLLYWFLLAGMCLLLGMMITLLLVVSLIKQAQLNIQTDLLHLKFDRVVMVDEKLQQLERDILVLQTDSGAPDETPDEIE